MKRILLLFLSVLISASAFAQKRFDKIKYPELNEFKKADVEEFTLDNGISFFLVEDKELPLIRVNVTVRTGGLLEPEDKAGLASMTGSVMREGGSVNYPADELNELLENKSAYISTYIGFGSGGASMNLLKEDFDDLLPVFVDVIQNPAFPEDKIELEKTQTKSSIARRNDNPQSIASREFQKLIYGEETPYTTQTEYATVDAINREDMIDFHEQAFVGNNMMIGVIGDFDTSEMKRKLEEAFGSLDAGTETNLLYPDIPYHYPSTVNLVDKPDVTQSTVFVGHIGGLRENPDYAALQLLNEVLSSGFSGRLMQTVRTDLGLAYAVFGNYSSNINYPGIFYVGVMTKSSTTTEAIDAMLVEVKKLQDKPVSSEELGSAKDRFLNSLVFRYDSKNKILNERISYEYNGLPSDYFDQYVEELKKVSSADIQRVAKKYLKPEQVQILVVGNAAEIGDQLDKYGTVNMVDVTIPTPDDGKEEVAGDAVQGKLMLNKMAEALIGDSGEIGTLTVNSKITQVTPMGDMEIGNNSSINFSEMSLTQELKTPRGDMTLELKDGAGKVKMMGQEQALPPTATNPMFNELRQHFLNIALKKDDLKAEFMGMESIDGKEYPVLKVLTVEPITYILDPDTFIPHSSKTSQFNPQTAATDEVTIEYFDWKEGHGISYPHKWIEYRGEEKSSETVVESVSVN